MNTKLNAELSRRHFLKASATAAVLAALSSTPIPSFAQGNQDLQILNYALTLEHLEARAYRDANASGLLTGNAAKYFQTFGAHEATHVTALTDTINKLGGTPVKAQAQYNWPTFKSQSDILTFFHTVEELGAAAYLGQAPRIQSPDLLTTAVSIHNVEGQHAAVLSDLIGVSPAPAFATAKSMDEVLAVVTPFLSAPGSQPSAMPSTGGGWGASSSTMLDLFLGALGFVGAAGVLHRRSRKPE